MNLIDAQKRFSPFILRNKASVIEEMDLPSGRAPIVKSPWGEDHFVLRATEELAGTLDNVKEIQVRVRIEQRQTAVYCQSGGATDKQSDLLPQLALLSFRR